MPRRHLLYFFVLVFYGGGAAYGQGQDLQSIADLYLRQALSARLGIRNDQFKICQASTNIGYTSTWLWNIFNAIVSNDTGYYYNPAQYNNFSQDYGLILRATKVTPAVPACSLSDAIVQYSIANGAYAWNKTIDDLNTQLNVAPPLEFNIDTTIMASATGPTNMDITIKIHASFSHISVFICYPFSQKDTLNPQLSDWHPWYSYCILAGAYKNVNNSVLTTADWNSFFGANGCMQRVCSALVIADSGFISVYASDLVSTFSKTSSNSVPFLLGVLIATMPDYLSQR